MDRERFDLKQAKESGPRQPPAKCYSVRSVPMFRQSNYCEALRKIDLATNGVIFVCEAGGPNALSKLSRYETSMERSLYIRRFTSCKDSRQHGREKQ